jgi:hypothetical protein
MKTHFAEDIKQKKLETSATTSLAILLSASQIEKNRTLVYEREHLSHEKLQAGGRLLSEEQFKSIVQHIFTDATTASKTLKAAIKDDTFNEDNAFFSKCLFNFQAYLVLLLVIFGAGQRAHQIAQYCTNDGMELTNVKNKDEFEVRVAFVCFYLCFPPMSSNTFF